MTHFTIALITTMLLSFFSNNVFAKALFSTEIMNATGMNLDEIKPPATFDNIFVTPLGSSETASEYVIFIKHKVKAHKHNNHTELVYVLSGEGVMRLGSAQHAIKKGDFIRINKGVIHAVVVTSETPLKVLSIQTPKFEGKDRIFVTDEEISQIKTKKVMPK